LNNTIPHSVHLVNPFLNDLVKSLSGRIKEQTLPTLDGAFSILANTFESDQFLCAEEL
jgi:hypothetical protein